MALDLTEAQLTAVRQLLVRYVPGARVLAFGSRATGTSWRYSDLDLAVYGADAKLGALREAFQESDLPFSVDVSDGAQLPAWLQTQLARTGVVLQEAADRAERREESSNITVDS